MDKISDGKMSFAKGARALGAMLILGLAIVAASTIFDRTHWKNLDTFSQPTAVGDRAYFPKPKQLSDVKIVLSGVAYNAKSLEPIKVRDTRMTKVAVDDSSRFILYAPANLESVKGATAESRFLKTDSDEYLEMDRQ